MEMTRRIAAAAVLMTLGAVSAQAADFKMQPKPGLWKSNTEMMVNGEDVMAKMAAAREKMMEKMTPEMRASMQDQMKDPREQLSCVTPAQIEKFKDVDSWMKYLSEDSGCDFHPTAQTSTSVDFAGSCSGTQGFSGDYTGKLVSSSANQWTMTMNGKGNVSVPGGTSKPMEQNFKTVSTWQAADCGDVQPDDQDE